MSPKFLTSIGLTIVVLIVGSLNTLQVAAQIETREVPLPLVTMVQPPRIEHPIPSVSMQRQEEAEILLGRLLTESKLSDLDVTTYYRIQSFAPVGTFVGGKFLGQHLDYPKLKYSPAFVRLVELGPDALPLLLEKLDDPTPTNLVITPDEFDGGGDIIFTARLHGNPVNPLEQLHLGLINHEFKIYQENIYPDLDSYVVKLGDICLVIVGQIVGRQYTVVRGAPDKEVNSPVENPQIAEKVRAIWSTENPHQRLLESLLLDFSTRGVLRRQDSLDKWGVGQRFQLGATKRMLFYFPDVGSKVIIQRADEFQHFDDFFEQSVVNGVRIHDFIEAISWKKSNEIEELLERLNKIAKCENVIDALARIRQRKEQN